MALDLMNKEIYTWPRNTDAFMASVAAAYKLGIEDEAKRMLAQAQSMRGANKRKILSWLLVDKLPPEEVLLRILNGNA